MNAASEVWQVEGHALQVSHLEKLFWPEAGFTKQDMLRYYLQIASVSLPHFRDRPVTLCVFPEGTSGTSFYQRELPSHAPSWMATEVYHPRTGDSGAKTPRAITTPLINDGASLIWLANGGCVEFHLWRARAPHLDLPDQAIFDLDPGENVPFSRVLEAGLRLREHLESLGIASYAKWPMRNSWRPGRSPTHAATPESPRFGHLSEVAAIVISALLVLGSLQVVSKRMISEEPSKLAICARVAHSFGLAM